MQPLLFLDTETTDLEDGRLVELAFAIHYPDNPEPDAVLTFRVKPPVPISIDATATHHIKDSDVINYPSFLDHPSYKTVSDIVKDNVLVAHNAPYDIAVLAREGIEVGRWIDTRRLSMHLYPDTPKHALQYLRYYLGCQVHGVPHSAEGDVTVLIAIFQKMAARIHQEYETKNHAEMIEKAIELSTKPALLRLVPYRLKKWAGTPFSEVNRLDRSYIEWAWKQDWEGLDIKEDLLHTLDHWRRIHSI